MSLWILLSKATDSSFLKNEYIQNELPHLRRRKITVNTIEETDFDSIFNDNEAVFLVPEIVNDTHIKFIEQCNQKNVPVITFEALRILCGRKYNYISEDVTQTVWKALSYLNVYRKKRIAFFCAQNNYMDVEKLSTFCDLHPDFSKKDVFCVKATFEDCFEKFFDKRSSYDAIICNNNVSAVYLMEKMGKADPKYLKNTMIVSLEDSLLSRVYHKSITTFSYDRKSIPQSIVSLYRFFKKNRSGGVRHDIKLETRINVRESTMLRPEKDMSAGFETYDYRYGARYEIEEHKVEKSKEIQAIYSVEKFFQCCEFIDLQIMLSFLQGKSHEDTAEELFLSVHTIKKRSTYIYNSLSVKSKREFRLFLSKYVEIEKLRNLVEESET